MVDMAHFAGLVAADLHPNPVPYADVVTTTVHKTLGGARGGMILCREEYAKKINSAVFPGQQGGPLEHVIAGKAVALQDRRRPSRSASASARTVAGAKAVAEELLGAGNGVNVLTGGTDVHLVLVDLRESELDGQMAEDRLHEIGITVNRNAVPFDPRPPAVSSGLRVGTSALATRGVQADDFREIGAHHRPRAAAGLRGGEGRPGRARDRDRRALPALRAARRASRRRRLAPAAPAAAAEHQPPRQLGHHRLERRRHLGGGRAVGRARARASRRSSSASGAGVRRGSGAGSRTSCGKRSSRVVRARGAGARGNGRSPGDRVVERRAEAEDVGRAGRSPRTASAASHCSGAM